MVYFLQDGYSIYFIYLFIYLPGTLGSAVSIANHHLGRQKTMELPLYSFLLSHTQKTNDYFCI
jgi:hypothetical protein